MGPGQRRAHLNPRPPPPGAPTTCNRSEWRDLVGDLGADLSEESGGSLLVAVDDQHISAAMREHGRDVHGRAVSCQRRLDVADREDHERTLNGC
jgi:hypothetical protein